MADQPIQALSFGLHQLTLPKNGSDRRRNTSKAPPPPPEPRW